MAQTFLAKSTNTTYVCLQDLKTNNVNPDFFKGCGTSIRACLKKNNIPENEIIFVDKNKVSNKKNTRAQPYVTEKYAKEWIYDVNKIKEYRESIKTQKKEELNKTRIEQKQYDVTQLQPLPPIVEISDEEAFKDTDGNILHIEMRGEKTQEGLYMKALDIQNKLGIDRVYDGVTHTNSDYEYNIHYVFFLISPVSKVLYLTFTGFVKLIMCNRKVKNKISYTQLLTSCTLLFASQESKEELAATCMGISLTHMRSIAKTCSSGLHGIYLFAIGKVSDLHDTFVFDTSRHKPNDIVYKYGFTKDIDKRYGQHLRSFGRINGVTSLEHKIFANIDPMFLSKAECKIKNIFSANNWNLADSTYKEIVVIPKSQLNYVKKTYYDTSELYKANINSMAKQILSLEDKIDKMKLLHQNEVKDKEIQILQLRLSSYS